MNIKNRLLALACGLGTSFAMTVPANAQYSNLLDVSDIAARLTPRQAQSFAVNLPRHRLCSNSALSNYYAQYGQYALGVCNAYQYYYDALQADAARKNARLDQILAQVRSQQGSGWANTFCHPYCQ